MLLYIKIGDSVMVKGLKVLLLVVSVFLIVGCMDYRFNMTVNQDKSVDISMNMEMDMFEFSKNIFYDEEMRNAFFESMFKELCSSSCSMYNEGTNEFNSCVNECLDGALSDVEIPSDSEIKAYLDEYFNSEEFNEDDLFSDENRSELESKGYTVETNLDKENYIYSVHVSQHFANIDDISSTSLTTMNLDEVFNGNTDNIFFLKTENNTYQANYTWELENDGTNDVDISQYITVNYEVTLPNSAINNNADETSNDNKTLTWTLNEDNSINYEFSFLSNDDKTSQNLFGLSNDTLKIVAYALIIGGSVGLVITILVLVKVSRKKG